MKGLCIKIKVKGIGTNWGKKTHKNYKKKLLERGVIRVLILLFFSSKTLGTFTEFLSFGSKLIVEKLLINDFELQRG